MKKTLKKFFTTVLSFITAACFLIGCDVETVEEGGSEVKGENYAVSSYVASVTTNNTGVEYGETTLVGSNKTVKGLVLTGGKDSVFNLGDVNVAKSNWEGTVNTITDKFTSFIDFYYAPTANASELPSLKIKLTDVTTPNSYIEIIINNYKPSKATEFSSDLHIMAKASVQDKYSSYLNAQKTVSVSSDGKNYGASMPLKSGYYGDAATVLGYEEGASTAPNGNATAPISLVYDKEENMLYSPVTNSTHSDASSQKTSFAIRSFNNVYGGKTDNSDPKKWSGFATNLATLTVEFLNLNDVESTKIVVTGVGGYDITGETAFVLDSDFEKYVPAQPLFTKPNQSVELIAPLNYTLIKSMYDKDSKVVISGRGKTETLNFTSETQAYTFTESGEYTLDFYYGNGEKASTYIITVTATELTTDGLDVAVSTNATATYGTYKQILSGVDFTGIRLTGTTGASFDLGSIDIGSSDWAGDYHSTGKPSGANGTNTSLLELVLDPHDNLDFKTSGGGGTGELQSVFVTFTQGSDSMTVKVQYYSYNSNDGGREIMVTAKAGIQESDFTKGFGAYRSTDSEGTIRNSLTGGIRKGRIVTSDFANLGISGVTDKYSGCWGSSTIALPVYYDFNDVALYTPSQYQATAKGLNDSYLIRDFDSTEARYNSTDPNLVIPWSGFKKDSNGKCVVNVSVTFGTVRGVSPSSVVITKLGNHDFTKGFVILDSGEYETDKISTPTNATIGKSVKLSPVYEKWHPLNATAYENCIVEIYRQGETEIIDTITFDGKVQSYTYNSVGVYVLKYYDSPGGKQLGSDFLVTVSEPEDT